MLSSRPRLDVVRPAHSEKIQHRHGVLAYAEGSTVSGPASFAKFVGCRESMTSREGLQILPSRTLTESSSRRSQNIRIQGAARLGG